MCLVLHRSVHKYVSKTSRGENHQHRVLCFRTVKLYLFFTLPLLGLELGIIM